jgi:hypothetical protein
MAKLNSAQPETRKRGRPKKSAVDASVDIRKAALKAFARAGFNGVSVVEIAKMAGDAYLHGVSQDAVESVLRPQEPPGILGTGGADFGAHYVDGAFDLDSHAGFESVHTLFSLTAMNSVVRVVCLGIKRVSKTPYSG